MNFPTISRPFALLWILLVCASANAKQPFELTHVFGIGGGGCVGETRIYDDAAVSRVMVNEMAASAKSVPKSSKEWRSLDRNLAAKPRHFMTTMGCAADRLVISLDGKAYLLDLTQIRQIGMPVTYYSDVEGSPQVRIELVTLLHSIDFRETECTQRFDRVRVHIDFKGGKQIVSALATASCP
jgi:hypothetical protein